MDKRDFAFDKVNYILLAVGMAVVVLGFLLMSGSGSTETAYDPDIKRSGVRSPSSPPNEKPTAMRV